ncbi:hypothetical protein PR202_gb21378 [Eleusine coracana subsp. coracana]|uniref:Ubiquitin-like domain-containing protein n=1 Tax=Eleusine coracana subsp. coracana TaxID=191504 RepID=A0AAV5FCY9_ELECO|nr:hypothetical protein QOZ80_7BG0605300 [Eleusine coracana subsp. coracana]GJN32841.1 hypothetical protein PR202_gb21378 [Eleusine coracana subsp. coracana]
MAVKPTELVTVKVQDTTRRTVARTTIPVPKSMVVKPTQLVTVKVQDTKRRTVTRTMRRTDKLQGLMDYYYEVVSPAVAARGEGRFVFDGKRVKGEHTPEDLNMVNGDMIDFFLDLMAG